MTCAIWSPMCVRSYRTLLKAHFSVELTVDLLLAVATIDQLPTVETNAYGESRLTHFEFNLTECFETKRSRVFRAQTAFTTESSAQKRRFCSVAIFPERRVETHPSRVSPLQLRPRLSSAFSQKRSPQHTCALVNQIILHDRQTGNSKLQIL